LERTTSEKFRAEFDQTIPVNKYINEHLRESAPKGSIVTVRGPQKIRTYIS
jgi:hypothetical protein